MVYDWIDSSWIQRGSNLIGEVSNDQFGISISLSDDGNTIAVGANANDGSGANSGHVRIYSWNGSVWSQKGVDINGENSQDEFGYSVSLSSDGNVIAAGGYANDGNGSSSGHARVFSWDGSSWLQVGSDIDGEASDDESGSSISLSSNGTILAIGAKQNDGNGNNSGHVEFINGTEVHGSTWL